MIGRMAMDTVTGYKGEITAHTTFKTGVDRVMIESMDNTGRPIEWWFDVDRLELLDEEEEI